MADIDLIPPDYRDWLAQRALLRRYLILLAVLTAAILAASEVLGQATKRAQTQAMQLQSDNAITQQQHLQLKMLKDQESEYRRQWSLLRGLRAGAAIEDIFRIIDQTLVVGELWFVDWSFRRAGVIVDGEQRGIETGYFIVVSSDGDADSATAFDVETHMSIHGQAKDHQALSTFVRALFSEKFIKDVSVRKTTQVDFANGRVVDFDITVILNSTSKES